MQAVIVLLAKSESSTVLVRAESTQSSSPTTRESINVQAFFFNPKSMHRVVVGFLDHVPGFCARDGNDRFCEDGKHREECLHRCSKREWHGRLARESRAGCACHKSFDSTGQQKVFGADGAHAVLANTHRHTR